MGKDRVVKTSSRRKPGFFEKIGSNAAGSVAGFALFLLSFYILYSNESRSVETEAVLEEASQLAISINGAQDVDRTNGQLVHLSGPLEADVLSDPKYPVALPCVKLSRRVEMYQWVEHSEVHEYKERNEIKTETTYTYNAEWSPALHRSRDFAEEFGHQNPTEMPVSNLELTADNVKVNGLELSTSALRKINWFEDMESLPEPPEITDIELHEKYYYHARDPYSPDVGDVRVSFRYAGIAGDISLGPRDQITIIARNSGGRLTPYQIRSSSIELVHRGLKKVEEVIKSEIQSNATLTWGLRFLGWALMFLGMSIMTKIIRTLFSWIPIIGSIVSASVTMFNITSSISLSLITIAIGWLRARPILSITLGAVSIIPWILSRMRAGTMAAYKSR